MHTFTISVVLVIHNVVLSVLGPYEVVLPLSSIVVPDEDPCYQDQQKHHVMVGHQGENGWV